jgi:hypothetical protein
MISTWELAERPMGAVPDATLADYILPVVA